MPDAEILTLPLPGLEPDVPIAEHEPTTGADAVVTPPPRPPAPDQSARDRIAEDLGQTLFVEAGAGSGKTTALVARVVALVTSGTASLDGIAAITFTEKAAAELRDRIRARLGDRRREALAAADDVVAARCRAALDALDGAAIGTLHSFAQRLLSEHPVEAGLPPRVEVLDEVTSGVDFERRWTTFRDALLDDPDEERTLLLLLASGVRLEALRAVAVAFDHSWDLVEERVPTEVPPPPDVQSFLAEALRAVDVAADDRDCTDPDDKLAAKLAAIRAYADRLRAIDDEVALLEALDPKGVVKPPSFSVGGGGKQASWGCDLPAKKAAVRAAGDGLLAVRDRVASAAAERLGSVIRRFTLGAAGERRRAGRLEFHDLLVMARALLRHRAHGPAVRRRLHERYTHLLLDEFQDTDPIQIELATRIAAQVPDAEDAGEAPWSRVDVRPGHLFVVGDPKQSIYRFRRADVGLFMAARDRFAPEAGGVVPLTANFRTGASIIHWINRTFAELMGEGPQLDLQIPSQPEYVRLDPVRPDATVGPPVSVIGREALVGAKADLLRGAEAADVAATVSRAVGEGWLVDDGEGGFRPARLGDVAILVPARTSLPFLEDALDAAGIPYRAESSSLVYGSRAVRDLLLVLRAADDPTDELRTVAALRTPLLACGDDDLVRFRIERGGTWTYTDEQPATVPDDDPVRIGLELLRHLHEQRRWSTPSELLSYVAAERRAFELGFAEGRPRDVWRRLRFVVDQARAWHEATGGSLREYLQWVTQQTAEGVRVAESVLPETDDDAVRILTIHAAKGLEFPITIVSGMSTRPGGMPAAADVVFPADRTGVGAVGYRFGSAVKTREFETWKPIDEQMAYDERIRLLYVACTRAKDHLVVSLYRNERRSEPAPQQRTNAELLLRGMGDALDDLEDAAEVNVAFAPPVPSPPAAPPPYADWDAERTAALSAAGRRRAVAATGLTADAGHDVSTTDAGLVKGPRDLDLPPWLKGRYGTAVGRAVHGVLQTIDLAGGSDVDGAVRSQCQAEAIVEREGDVRRLVAAALSSPVVQEAAAAPHWREVYACTPLGDRLLEGYVDLLYRRDDGLVVVDYKTAATSDPGELDHRVAGYRVQGASYALVVAESTGEPVTDVVFLFLTPDGPVARSLPDLTGGMAEVRALVARGAELVLDDDVA